MMAQPSRTILWQLYLLSVCLLCLGVLGIAGTYALLGGLRLQYPHMMVSAESWDATRASGAVAGTGTLQSAAPPRPAWQIKREIMRRERHLGRRQVVYGASAAIVAMLIFLPHWWLAQRFTRAPR